jgi:hypothetical protein
MDRSSATMLSSLLISGTTPSALNLKKIVMTALCRQTKQATPTNVGFHAHTTMITPFFGGCLCGVPNTDGIPCNHMCVVVKSYRIEGLNETNIMPIWWHTSHRRRKYPADSVVRSTVDIESLCNAAASTKSNHMDFKLCPPYSAGRKGGRSQEEKRIKGAIEIAIDKTEKKKKMVETRKKRKSIEPDDLVEYRNIKRKRKKETVAKVAEGKRMVTKRKEGKQKSGYKKRVTQQTTTSPKKKKATRGN